MRILKREDVQKLITMKEVINLMRGVFESVGRNEVVLPERTIIEMANKTDAVLFMPGYIPSIRGIGTKIVTVFPGNVSRGIPTINAQVLLNDPETGEITCMMEGGLITAMRTAAVSAVATDILAIPEARTLGIFGAGVQAKSQVEAICEIRPIDKVIIFDLQESMSQKLVEDLKNIWGNRCAFKVAKEARETVTESDVIVTVTTSKEPVFDGTWLRDGTHINAVGSFKPQVREVDDKTIRRALLFVDSRELSLVEGGDLIIPLQKGLISELDIKAELGELILGQKPGRSNPKEITFFKSVGMAVQDIAVAKTIYQKAEKQNIGIVF